MWRVLDFTAKIRLDSNSSSYKQSLCEWETNMLAYADGNRPSHFRRRSSLWKYIPRRCNHEPKDNPREADRLVPAASWAPITR